MTRDEKTALSGEKQRTPVLPDVYELAPEMATLLGEHLKCCLEREAASVELGEATVALLARFEAWQSRGRR